jgi:hypothetical protein
MRILRRLRAQPPRAARRRDFDVSDATMEADPGPPPEAVFDRSTGPWDRRSAVSLPGAADEET